MQTVTDLDRWAVLYAFGCSLLFLIGVSLIWKWWRSLAGRAMVLLDVMLALALLPSAIHQVFGLSLISEAFAWYYFGSLVSVGTTILWRLRVVWRVQRHE